MSTIDSVTYTGSKTVTPSDSANDPAAPFAGFYTGSGGSIRVLDEEGNDTTFANLPAGTVMTLAILRVFVTGTTATGVKGMIARPHKGQP